MPVALRLVPGLGLDTAAWRPTLDALTTAPPDVGVVELPGYGRPATRAADLSPAALSADVLESHDGTRRMVLVGHSASCQVVVRAAERWPELVAGLVLVGPTTDPRAQTWPALVRRWLATARHEPPGQVPTLLRQYSRTRPATMARAMEAARHDDVRDGLRAIDCPLLVIRGRHDRICPDDWAAGLAALTRDPRSRSATLADGGHMVPLTHGRLVGSAIDRFLTCVD